MTYVALLVALAALFMAWRSSRALRHLREHHVQLNSRLLDLRVEMHQATQAHEKALARLKFELLRQSGDLKVTSETTIDEIMQLHPQAAALLAGFHIGGCASCAVDGTTRLSEAVSNNGGHLEPLLVALNDLVTQAGDPLLPGERLRTPNVQLLT
jgi:hypothetical protein